MIQGAIFDVDGTLLDSMWVWEQAPMTYLRRLGVQPEENLAQKLYELTMERGADYVNQKYELGKSSKEIISDVNRIAAEFYQKNVELKKGVLPLLEMFKRQNVPMTVATSSDRWLIEAAFERLDIMKYFQKIFTCTEVGRGKHLPDIFLQAADCMGTQPALTIVFEDGLYAAKTAKAAGFCVAGVYDPAEQEDQQELRSLCDFYITDANTYEMVGRKLMERPE